MLYPLAFNPIFKERIWGGRAIAKVYGKDIPPELTIGESWEICDRPEDVSVIRNGPLAGRNLRWLVEEHGSDLFGESAAVHKQFPLLVKILDAEETLSVQVHPSVASVRNVGGEPKTEMWY